MTVLTEANAPAFWDKLANEGYTPDDLAKGRITDLGSKLCEFMQVRIAVVAQEEVQRTEAPLSA